MSRNSKRMLHGGGNKHSFNRHATRQKPGGNRKKKRPPAVTTTHTSRVPPQTFGQRRTSETLVEVNKSSPSWMPFRYRAQGERYSSEDVEAAAWRLPLFVALAGLFVWEETAPYTLLTIEGPSMIPTMAPDRSEIWLRNTGKWRFWTSLDQYYRVGDLVGFCYPDNDGSHVSCKRIVGVAGDAVRRYGQHVYLYMNQDPENWGRTWPDKTHPVYGWMDPRWDQNFCEGDRLKEASRRLVVPPGHVWLEADCPGMGIDSRQFGPVPISWLRGKIVARFWPLWRKEPERRYSYLQRPHPICLDTESLRRHNIHVAVEQEHSDDSTT